MRRLEEQIVDNQHENSSTSSSSSTDSNINHDLYYYRHHQYYDANHHFRHQNNNRNDDLSTDLKLGLSISPPRGQHSDWPPIKALLRSTLCVGKSSSNCRRETLFVKVYMEGTPIGRKLDLLAHHGYHTLISTLAQMFKTTILSADSACQSSHEKCHILTYEDKEGDWMMVGDVPWEMFLTTVKRLKIATMEKCHAC